MNSIAPKLPKRWTHKIAFKIVSKMLKQPNFFQSWPSTLSKDTPAKFYISTTFGLRLMISSVAPTRLSTFYAYLITKVGNRNLNVQLADFREPFPNGEQSMARLQHRKENGEASTVPLSHQSLIKCGPHQEIRSH